MPKKLLLIEDEELFHDLFKYEVGDFYNVVSAYTVEEAAEKLKKPEEFDAILIDGCVPGDKLNTIPLINSIIEQKYNKPVIAISSYPEYRKEMVSSGCTHEVPKKDAAALIKSLVK